MEAKTSARRFPASVSGGSWVGVVPFSAWRVKNDRDLGRSWNCGGPNGKHQQDAESKNNSLHLHRHRNRILECGLTTSSLTSDVPSSTRQ